jgi:tRNA (uracil-5-)-methyltransferase TRM9
VDTEIAQYLLKINYQFYQTFSSNFSATRQAVQPGVRRILGNISPDEGILDIGCGNGNFWNALASFGHRGVYVGVDFSPELLRIAALNSYKRRPISENSTVPVFIPLDLSEADWELKLTDAPFDHVVAFAVLHHIPGEEMRISILNKIRQLISQNGEFTFSVWQFMNSKRLRSRLHNWSEVGLSNQQVDYGDYLLDWRSGGKGLRYIHNFDEQELINLAKKSGYQVKSSFYSDGAGNNLGLYQIWEVAKG